MKHIVWVGLILSTAAAGGTAYKSIGPDGTVTFSDRPMPNAEEVRLPEPSTYAPPALPQGAGLPLSSAPPVSGGEYSGFAITAPKDEETLHNRDRWVDIDLSLDPGLLEGDTFTLILDGAELAKGLRTNHMRLTDVERGPHQLEATIYDAAGQEVLRSQPIRFYLVTETLIKEPLEAQKEKLKDGELTLEQRVWDKWVQDLGQYGTKIGGDPLPKAAPPVPPVGSPPKGSAYEDALKKYQKASDVFDETHGTFRQPTVDPAAPYKPGYSPPGSGANPYAPPAKQPSFVPTPPARPPYSPSYSPK
jgi:hypothetical protein